MVLYTFQTISVSFTINLKQNMITSNQKLILLLDDKSIYSGNCPAYLNNIFVVGEIKILIEDDVLFRVFLINTPMSLSIARIFD